MKYIIHAPFDQLNTSECAYYFKAIDALPRVGLPQLKQKKLQRYIKQMPQTGI